MNENTAQNTPSSALDNKMSVVSPHKNNNIKNIVVAALVLLVLILGTAAGVILVRKNQEIREKAAGGSECEHSKDCVHLDGTPNEGSYTAERDIASVTIKAGTGYFNYPGSSSSCYAVTIDGKVTTWKKIGPGPDCKDVSFVAVWLKTGNPTPTPSCSNCIAKCESIKTYDTNWNELTLSQLHSLKTGNTARFTVQGTCTNGSIQKARFVINGVIQPETTSKRSGTDEFYYDYTLPEGVYDFRVQGQLYHSEYGWF